MLLGGHEDSEVSVAVAKFLAIPGNELAKWLLRAMPKLSWMTFWLGACPANGTGHAADNLDCHHKRGTPSSEGAEVRTFSALPAKGVWPSARL